MAALLVAWLLHTLAVAPALAPRPVTYSELLAHVERGEVVRARVEDRRVLAELAPPAGKAAPAERDRAAADGKRTGADGKSAIVAATRVPGLDDDPLVEGLLAKGVDVTGHIEVTPWWQSVLLGAVLPLLLMFALWSLLSARLAKHGPLSLGRAGPKIVDRAQEKKTTFDDVAGVDDAKGELLEVVDFLKNPERYRAVGARMPKGVLLVGPPGTGKTLLARAVAGEAGVPFFSMSGSEFVEMFVGLGAARMRDLFQQAKQRAPCIVFIDEIDAIGKSRGGLAALATHDEREQTLNQLLVEMDGFAENSGVVLMAATNRPEVLDPALLRPGRFDRHVVVDRPELPAREAILGVHARRLRLADDVDLERVARATPGMSGADLANVVNEAALAAARRRSNVVARRDFDEGLDRVLLGLRRTGAALSDDERRRVAVHEAGHAVVALSCAMADPVHRVSIVPRSVGALGVTMQLPADRKLATREELRDRLAVLLGGREAEQLLTGDVSTGAADDLEKATALARRMVQRFGMGDATGPLAWSTPASGRFLGVDDARPPVSEATARAIDEEVRRIVEAARRRACDALVRRRPLVERLVEELLAHETVDEEALRALVADVEERHAAA